MMKPPMPKGGDVKMGGHMSKEPKLDRGDTAKLKMDDMPRGRTKAPSSHNETKSGGPGMGGGGMSRACKTLTGMKA